MSRDPLPDQGTQRAFNVRKNLVRCRTVRVFCKGFHFQLLQKINGTVGARDAGRYRRGKTPVQLRTRCAIKKITMEIASPLLLRLTSRKVYLPISIAPRLPFENQCNPKDFRQTSGECKATVRKFPDLWGLADSERKAAEVKGFEEVRPLNSAVVAPF